MAKVTVGDIATYVNGYSFKPDQWGTEGYPIVRIQNLTNPKTLMNHYKGNIPEKFRIRNGDLLISWSASLGVFKWDRGDAVLNQHIFKVVFDKPIQVNQEYYRYQMEYLMEIMERDVHGATMKHLTRKTFENQPFYLPDTSIQDHIANLLSVIDKSIKKCNVQLLLLNNLMKSRFIEMFGDTNNSMEWPIANVESIAKVKVGLVIKPTRFYSSSPTRYKAIRGLNISPFCINDTNWVYFTEDGAKSNKKTEVKENDVVVVRSGAPGTAAVVTKEYAGSNAIDVLIVEPDLTQIDPTYLCAYTNFPHGLKQISKGSGGAAQKHFNVEKYKNLTIFIPPLEKQKLFSIEKKEIDKSKLAIQKSIDELETLKKKLMQEYFG